MYNLYKVDFENGIHPFDTSSWLDDVNIYKYFSCICYSRGISESIQSTLFCTI
jgi:hypothetical protein